MKKGVSFAVILACGLLIGGCQKKEVMVQETETVVQTETESEIHTETETEAKAEMEEKSRPEKHNTVIGSLIDLNMETITILSDNGNEIILPLKNAEMDFRNGFRVGNLVAVEYTGELQKADNSKESEIQVLRVADSSDIAELKEKTDGEASTEKESESLTESEETSSETESGAVPKVKKMTGTLKEMNLNKMILLNKKKAEQTISIANARMYFAKGMKEGMKIAVSYEGEFPEENNAVQTVMDVVSFRQEAKQNRKKK